MNNEQKLVIFEAYKMMIDKIISDRLHYEFNEVEKIKNIEYKLKDDIRKGLVTDKDYAYVTIKLMGSESYYNFGLKYSKIDKRELMITRVENMLMDEECKIIKMGCEGKILFYFKRNDNGKWVDCLAI